mmetsp:Transcript_27739/g.69209  ORF Transcript_27739/g.69209 Transcript_27739/m.69209 type:complete len:95 (-) Transcript_27739:255-539(-)
MLCRLLVRTYPHDQRKHSSVPYTDRSVTSFTAFPLPQSAHDAVQPTSDDSHTGFEVGLPGISYYVYRTFHRLAFVIGLLGVRGTLLWLVTNGAI